MAKKKVKKKYKTKSIQSNLEFTRKLKSTDFKVDTYENDFGEIVLIARKGNTECWLANITDGRLSTDVIADPTSAKELGLKLTESGYMSLGGFDLENAVEHRLNSIEDKLTDIIKVLIALVKQDITNE